MPRPPRTYAKVYDQIRSNIRYLTEGVVVCIDPSIGSSSSMPGWAVYVQGMLMQSGTLEIDPTGTRSERLQRLVYLLRQLYSTYDPDILVYEEIAPRRYGGGNAESHASLLKAVGATLSVSGPVAAIGLPPTHWKKLVRSTYEKSDEADAIEMGHIAIEIARSSEPKRTRKYGSKKSSSRRQASVSKKPKQRRRK